MSKRNLCEKMKFKTKEELIRKATDEGYIGGVEEAFKSFAERVKFYKRYESKESMLWQEQRDIWDKCPNKNNVPYNAISLREYNRWLFDYCFGDVLDE